MGPRTGSGLGSADRIRVLGSADLLGAALGLGQSCDTVANINPFAIAEMGAAAADLVEILSTMPDLRDFLSTP